MGLFWITGVSGTGKSAVAAELTNRGYEAIDADYELCAWYNEETNRIIGTSHSIPRSEKEKSEFFTSHEWRISVDKVNQIAKQATNRDVFICGSVSNEKDVWDMFSGVVCLVADDRTITSRISSRTNNEFGKAQHEIENILKWNKEAEANYRSFGATIVDATQPVDKVVDEILEITDKR